MSEAKFTPGPWAVSSGFPDHVVPAEHVHRSCGMSIYEIEDRERFALVIAKADHNDLSGFSHEITEETAKANARLIAAAPDLYAALAELDEATNSPDVPRIGRAFKAAQAALAKARGESS